MLTPTLKLLHEKIHMRKKTVILRKKRKKINFLKE
jgi:hypothetical protein